MNIPINETLAIATATNETALATLANATNATAREYVTETFIPTVFDRFIDLVKAPFSNHEMLWIVLPLIVVMFAIEFYFGRYTHEEIGWNTAVANSLILVFVSIDLFRYMSREGTLAFNGYIFSPEILVAIIILLEGMALFFTDFFHFLPRKIAFMISSELPVNLTAYVGIAIVYSGIPFDLTTIFAAIFLLLILLAFFHLIQLIEPHAYDK